MKPRLKITIEELRPDPERPKYPDAVEIYTQILTDIDIPELVTFINRGIRRSLEDTIRERIVRGD